MTEITENNHGLSHHGIPVSSPTEIPITKISPATLEELRAVSTRVFRPKGTVLFHEGDRCQGAFLIRNGTVKLSLRGGERLYPSRTVESGGLVGLPATFSGESYSLTAEVLEDTDFDFVPRKKMLKLVRDRVEVAVEVLRVLSEEIFQMRAAELAAHATSRRRRSK